MDKDTVRNQKFKFSNKLKRVNYFTDNVADSKYEIHVWNESVLIDVLFIYKNLILILDIGPNLTEMEN